MKPQYILLSLCLVLAGCSYLDLEPEKKGTLQEVFEDRTSAEKFLYGCYGYLPASNDFNGEPQVWGAGDEVALTSQWGTDWPLGQSRPHGTDLGRRAALQLLVAPQKQETALTLRRLRPLRRHPPVLHLHRHGGRGSQRQRRRKGAVESRGEIPGRLFPLLAPAALRSHLPRRGNHPERRSEEVYYPTRRPYDECVGWIARKFDEAAGELKASRAYSALDMGRANYVAALAIKSRMLLYAASPLFNGNSEYYADFRNKNGEQLISQTYDKEKWKAALDATAEAIAAAEPGGIQAVPVQVRRNVAHAGGGRLSDGPEHGHDASPRNIGQSGHDLGRFPLAGEQPADVCHPRAYEQLRERSLRRRFALVPDVETFLTKNGLPIDKDPEFDYPHRYDPVQDEYGEWTAKMHLGRETRFYADIAYDRAHDYELRGNWTLYLRMGEKHPATKLTMGNDPNRDMQTINGYLVKKTVHPNSYFPNNSVSAGRIDWAWPLVRMTELYLNYAEAYVEYHGRSPGRPCNT